jgi:mRNA interferase HicA
LISGELTYGLKPVPFKLTHYEFSATDCVINKIVYNRALKGSEFKRWLEKQGAVFTPAKGSHLRVELRGKISVLPMHSKDLKKGLVEGIKKQLGLK